MSQSLGAIPCDIQQATFHRCHCCCIPIFYRPDSKVELMFDFPIICTKCGWVLVGWMAREGGGQVTNCTGRGFLMRLGDVLKNIIVAKVL